MQNPFQLTETQKENLISFAQELVRIKSYSGQEELAIKLVEKKMKELGYEEVKIDSMGNVVGRIESGEKIVMFDSHVDTVEVNDEDEWDFPPFGGNIVNGKLQGRGSVDMKSAAAASVFAAALAKNTEFIKDKTILVSCTVFEEDCDGENLKYLFKDLDIKPNYMVICEPSGNLITLGHKGKAQIKIKTQGISAHGSAPDKGVNAVYEMAEIIQRVEKLNQTLPEINGAKGTIVLSKISSKSASLNAVPTECEIYLDRRMVLGETKEDIAKEMDKLIVGKNATWEVGTLYRTSWTGLEFSYDPLHPAWKIDENHELTQACVSAYKDNTGKTDVPFEFWDFSTNAVTPVSMGIPTIGFGPGEYKLAHMRNEQCEVSQIIDACSFYLRLISKL
ncbi:YgeY family selenium metabolism-linked hydrolase [Chondrinema litorale]|uniref:YgeY family selenium metabolism-linked hydrolase n=1 Tax=Chondrinema litorale TaxID=2994555 RepID=UPI002543904C|nr:YgeY family selenium metabolism-linked hydrolase [Chondrinema litorale]UZR96596.1 YgeY family selenium metabolism-linked hydrolase [Chondrinema litorale]